MTHPHNRADTIPRLLFWFVIVAAVVGYGALHIQVPLFADDYCRAASEPGLQKSLALAWKQYFTWSGRFPVMTLNWLVFSGGTPSVAALSVASAAMLFLLCLMVVRIRSADAPHVAKLLLVVCLLFLWWMTPDTFGEVALWKSGTLQYFWGTVLAVYCLAPILRLTVLGERVEYGPVHRTVYAVVCLAGGMWLEHLGVSVSAVWLLLLVVQRWILKRETPRWLWFGWGMWTLGVVALVAAPGNYARADVLGERNVFTDKLVIISERLLDKVDPKLWLTYVIFLAAALLRPAHRAREQVAFSVIFVMLAVLSAVSLAGAPNVMFFDRIAYPSEFFLILAVVFAFPVHIFSTISRDIVTVIQKSIVVILCTMMALLLIIDYRNVFNTYSVVRDQTEAREEQTAQARRNQVEQVALRPLYFSDTMHTGNGEIKKGRLFARDITTDPNHWLNNCYKNVHGLKSVVLEP